MTHVAILCLRDEAAFLLDWLAHHRTIGVDHFVICTNDCSDGTDAMADRLEEMGLATHIRNDGPYDKGGIQFTGLKAAGKTKAVRKAGWLLALDIDEYVNIHTGDHTINALHAALPDASAITLTWRLFGCGGQANYTDTPVTETFTRAAPAIMHWPWRASMFKTLYRNDGTYKGLGVHRPRQPVEDKLDQSRWFDGEGRELDAQFKNRRIFNQFGRSNTKLVQLNHYALGAMESFVLKAARGRAVHSDDTLGLDYWVERNFVTDEDRSILSLQDPVASYRTELGGDPVLGKLHKDAVAWRHEKFASLMAEEPYRALMGRLLTTPPSQPIPENIARILITHATKARQARNTEA